ncbi:MAG: hypothetical protein NWF09_02220 [Candidatus Bathyarchaeota archaeon]|nr:hypothetical protein [Candidatus Bathyarchaeota archaeon]
MASQNTDKKEPTACNIELFKLTAEHFRQDLREFWNRANFYLLINTGLFSAFLVVYPQLANNYPVIVVIVPTLGIAIALIWFFVLRGAYHWISQWREEVIRLSEALDKFKCYANIEKAGMQRIVESKPSKPVTDALAQLQKLGFDTQLLASTEYCKQKITETEHEKILTILETLSHSDATVRRRLARLSSIYPKHEEFMAKLSTMHTEALALTLKRLSFIAQTKVYLFWRNQSA